MIPSDNQIHARGIVSPCVERGTFRGKSFGLSACGYDVRFDYEAGVDKWHNQRYVSTPDGPGVLLEPGKSILVGVQEHFDMPADIAGFVKAKSSWARQGILPDPGVLEPGWCGHLSVLLYNVGVEEVAIVHGDPIAQIIFMTTGEVGKPYHGKYQDQKRGAQGPINER